KVSAKRANGGATVSAGVQCGDQEDCGAGQRRGYRLREDRRATWRLGRAHRIGSIGGHPDGVGKFGSQAYHRPPAYVQPRGSAGGARDSLKSQPLFTIDVCPWTWLRFNLHCANGTSMRGCSMTTIIAIRSPTACSACRRTLWSRGAGSI